VDAVAAALADLAPAMARFYPEGAARAFLMAALTGRPIPETPYDCLAIPFAEAGREIATAGFIAAAHAAGIAVQVWTVDDPETMRALIASNADGIQTDRPDVLRGVLG
jgi:glycerophosphoryl diester phosphodiesterase